MQAIQETDRTIEHQPNYGVEVSDRAIGAIVQHSFKQPTEPYTITKLRNSKSHNNRIYKLEFDVHSNDPRRSYILKVNGRPFGPAKVENEVACLLLLQRFCLPLPVPRVVSWSGDGTHLSFYTGRKVTVLNFSGFFAKNEYLPGWIMMSCLPGEPMDAYSLTPNEQADMAKQVADILKHWRQNTPRSLICANLHFQPASQRPSSERIYQTGALPGFQLHVYGFIGYGNDYCAPVTSLLQYWTSELDWHITKFDLKHVFALNKEPLLFRLRKFVKNTLPQLPLFQRESNDAGFVFTHSDFFPRNILVSGSPPKLTGIVDFELSGFSPPMKEFTHEWLQDNKDWPPDMHGMIIKELAAHGEATPRTLSPDDEIQIKNLSLLRKYIASMWLEDGTIGKEASKRQLHDARQEVEKALTALCGIVYDKQLEDQDDDASNDEGSSE